MSKAILVMDMPSRCLSCNCVGYIRRNVRINFCRIGGEILREDDYYKEKPDWCPLKPMPQKKEEWIITGVHGAKTHGFNMGYNACVDEILGGSE